MISPTDLHPSPATHFKTSWVFLIFFEVSTLQLNCTMWRDRHTNRHDKASIHFFAVLLMHLKRELQYLFYYISIFPPLNRFILVVHEEKSQYESARWDRLWYTRPWDMPEVDRAVRRDNRNWRGMCSVLSAGQKLEPWGE